MKIKLKKLYYNGKWRIPNSKKVHRHNTFEGVTVEIPNCNQIDIKNSISSAMHAQEKFSVFSDKKKSKILNKISIKIKENATYLAKKESVELGKDFISAKKEIFACANLWKHASKIVREKKIKTIKQKNTKLYEILEPVGVVALIIPWNFPMIVLSERLPYILAAGNGVVIKPSENGSLSIESFIRLISKVGLPPGTINYLTGDYKAGKNIVNNKNISMISFTGSTKTGKEIYNSASKTINSFSLELGGKNPMAVFSDANIKKACVDVVYSFTHNAGQCCVAGSKLFIEDKIFNKFLNGLEKQLKKINSFQNIATLKQYLKIKKLIVESIKDKIPIIFRSKKLFDDKKRIIYPIIFKPQQKIDYLENEIFGPVLTVSSFKSLDKLAQKMNDTKYGLSALIWSRNKSKAIKLASKIKFGRIWINGNISQNYPDISIGGYKESGLNRETGTSGLRTYSEIKSIIIN